MSDISFLRQTRSVHILGAGLNQDKPAHKAFQDMKDRGYRMVPVHPRDAGNTIQGLPIVPHPWASDKPELFVMFLSPDRTLGLLRKWLIAERRIPFIWLQPGAESEAVADSYEKPASPTPIGKCWVVTSLESDIYCEESDTESTLGLQTTSTEGDECSVWRYFTPGSDYTLEEPLEWVGDLMDLEYSNEKIPSYIRSLVSDGESLAEALETLLESNQNAGISNTTMLNHNPLSEDHGYLRYNIQGTRRERRGHVHRPVP